MTVVHSHVDVLHMRMLLSWEPVMLCNTCNINADTHTWLMCKLTVLGHQISGLRHTQCVLSTYESLILWPHPTPEKQWQYNDNVYRMKMYQNTQCKLCPMIQKLAYCHQTASTGHCPIHTKADSNSQQAVNGLCIYLMSIERVDVSSWTNVIDPTQEIVLSKSPNHFVDIIMHMCMLTVCLYSESHTLSSSDHTVNTVQLNREAASLEENESIHTCIRQPYQGTGSLLSRGIGWILPGLCGWSAIRQPASTRQRTPSGSG